jgi:hypothetical protein
MHVESDRGRLVLAAVLGGAALSIVLLVGGRPLAGTAAAQEAPSTPAPQQAPPAEDKPPAPPSPPEAQPAPPAEAPPRIIRVVCTDHICGHCDGKCHKESGHVAVDKKGHCACTPTEGSALDRATRDAYEKNQPK